MRESHDDNTMVPLDIETTGFRSSADIITTIIFHYEGTYHIFVNTDEREADEDSIKQSVIEKSPLDDHNFYVSDSEDKMLNEVHGFVREMDKSEVIFTAYNGETYRASTDFDLPFIRTRCLVNGVENIFNDYRYTDIYEALGEKSRIDTTVKATPRLDNLKKSDLKKFVQFINEKYEDANIRPDSLNKDGIVSKLKNNNSVNDEVVKNWVDENNISKDVESVDNIGDLTVKQLKNFITQKNYNIKYNKLTKSEIIDEIRKTSFKSSDLIEWYDETGRSIGTEEKTTLDGIHNVLVESNTIPERSPVDIEQFENFDPFDDSGEAVTAYKNENYSDVILHCLADVARTVNLSRIMQEYVPKRDYKPKRL